MISASPFDARDCRAATRDEVDYLLRRADHEAVAAIRADDPRVSEPHAIMALHYGEQSRALMERCDGAGTLLGD